MIVEHLRFRVAAAERSTWLAVEAEVWNGFLAAQPGFIDKQVWADTDDPDQVHVVVWWRDEAAWHAVPEEGLRACDAAMGSWWRESSCRAYEVVGGAAVTLRSA